MKLETPHVVSYKVKDHGRAKDAKRVKRENKVTGSLDYLNLRSSAEKDESEDEDDDEEESKSSICNRKLKKNGRGRDFHRRLRR
ncbi:MAG TPA: hypothetical protein VGO57_14140 [Verrucomicrobiae bacterium]